MRCACSLSLFVLVGFAVEAVHARPLPEPQPIDPRDAPVLIRALDEVNAEELRRRGAPPMALSYAKRFGEIRIDWRALGVQPEDGDAFRFVGGQRLIVEPFPGLRLEATGISVREGAEGARTWMGRIERPGWGQVTITRHRDAVFGSVDYGVDRYVFQSGRDGRIFVREADQRGLGRCAFDVRAEGLPRFDQGLLDRGAKGTSTTIKAEAATTSELTKDPEATTEQGGRKPATPAPGVAKSNGHATVDILVLYTPEVAAGAGGNPQAMIQNFVDHANMSFMDGQIQGSLNLIGTSQISGVNQALGPFATWEDRANELKLGVGAFSGVSTIRDALGADLVALLVVAGPEWIGGQWVWPEVCGVANGGSRLGGLTNPSVGSAEAFSITDTWCSAADLTFTHEIGHNLGGRHDDDTEDFRPVAARGPISAQCRSTIHGAEDTFMMRSAAGVLTFSCLVFLGLVVSGSTRAQASQPLWVPENGWYGEWVPGITGGPLGDRGRGVYFETQGNTAVVTVMTYESDGRPVMLYAAGALQTGVACVGLSTSEFTQFVTCIRNAELFRISGGVPLGQQGTPVQPPRTPEVVGRIELRAGHDFMRLSIHPPNLSLPPPGVWPDQMRLQRLQWGYGGFGGNLPIGGGLSGTALPMPGACIPDFRGDWVLVEPANRAREARRLVFDQVEQVVPNFNCGQVSGPEDAARIFVIFRDSQRQVELRCRASGCGYWDQGVYVGWVPRGYELKRFSVAVGVPDGGQIPQFPRAGRLVAYRVE